MALGDVPVGDPGLYLSWFGPGTPMWNIAHSISSADVGTPPVDAATAAGMVPDAPCATRWSWAIPGCWNWVNNLVMGDKYAQPPAPAVVRSTLPSGAPIPSVPPVLDTPEATGANAAAIAQSISNQQILDTQAQNQQFFSDLNTSLQADSSGVNWWLLGGLAVAGLVVVSGVFSGGRR
jgi:hypothetical protein